MTYDMARRLSLLDFTVRVVDLETTGFCSVDDRVCEIGWQDVHSSGKLLDSWESLVNPGIPIPPAASAVHHIADVDVQDAPPLESILPALPARVFAAHNAAFEKAFLGGLGGVWICTERLAKHAWPSLENHGNQFLRYALGLQPRIAGGYPAHRAMADVATTTEILLLGLQVLRKKDPSLKTVGELLAQLEQPVLLDRIPFKTANGARFQDATNHHLAWIVTHGAGGRDCVHSAQYWLDRRCEGADGLRHSG